MRALSRPTSPMPASVRQAARPPGPARQVARRLRRRLASEAGFAVPTVTLMIVAALGMAGVAVSTSIQSQGGTVRDQESKSALAVAESGVAQALLQFNRYGLVSESDPCAPLGTGSPDPETGWCGPVTGTAVDDGEVTYWARPLATEFDNDEVAFTELEVVAEGAIDGVTRRVDVTAGSSAGQEVFAKAQVKSKDGISLDQNAEIHAGSATNGDIVLEGKEGAKQCGTATVGIGKELIDPGEDGYFTDIECGTAGGAPEEEEITLDPVTQGEVPTENDNDRLFQLDRISGNKNTVCFDGLNGKGNSDTSCGGRELRIGSNSTVTLGGSVYSFCKLTLDSNSSLYIKAQPGETVYIYFDSPEACGYAGEDEPVTQLELRSNSRITSESGQPASVSMLFVGSEEIDTQILLNSETAVDGPCEQNFVIYAPRTDVVFNSETRFCGAVAGKTVHLDSNSEIWTSSAVEQWRLPLTAPHYVANRFVDCRADPVTGAPDAGC